MRLLNSPRLLLAVQVLSAGALVAGVPAGAVAGPQVTLLKAIAFQGGDEDDQAFARVAAGFTEGEQVAETGFQTVLAAIRVTDRFRAVTGTLEAGPDGVTARIRLDPWPPLKAIRWQGSVPRRLLKTLAPELHVGDRAGDGRVEACRALAQIRLVEGGYPAGQVKAVRQPGDQLLWVLEPGPPALVRKVTVMGNPAPYDPAKLLALANLKPGITLWTPLVQQEGLARLRKRLVKDKRFEAQVDLDWDGQGGVKLTLVPGPVVRLTTEGDGLGWATPLKEMVPIARAKRYSPELLDEGERRIVRFFRGKGYLDPQVGHRREVTRVGPGGVEERVTVIYTLHRGERSRIREVAFLQNREIGEAELRKAAALPRSYFNSDGPVATPDLMAAMESRVKAHYQDQGFTQASLRLQPLVRKNGQNTAVYRVFEGPRQRVQSVKLELPPGGFGDPWSLGECLPLLFSDRAVRVPQPGATRHYVSDRPAFAGVEAVVESFADPAQGGALLLSLTLSRPIPLLKADLARVFMAIKSQKLTALGVTRPLVRLKMEPTPEGTGILIEVPAQATASVQRLVVQGSLKTRAKAILRETQLKPGAPLDLDALSRAQARLGYLGAFQRVDLTSLADAPGAHLDPAQGGPPAPWQTGDLLLRLEERPPWVVTSSFGYDKSQGYHVGLGVQRLNFGGMGRTVDFGIRAGNGTIHNETLAKLFSVGDYDRSVDSYTLGYTDPWFAPPLLAGWLPDRTQFRTELAYIQEVRNLYRLNRRRLSTSLQWPGGPQITFMAGYRFERVVVQPINDNFQSAELAVTARYPPRVTISAPFVQVVRDTRDSAFDPTTGSYSVARLELANQLFLTSANSSFVKLDLRQQWTWPLGYKASLGVVALGLRLGVARPTASSSQNLPLSERFFAGGTFTHRGVEPDALGPQTQITLRQPITPFEPQRDENGNIKTQSTPLGGQALALINLEYRFPILGQTLWGEVFVDSGQVYESLRRQPDPAGTSAQFPPFRTALGLGLILKIGVPLKVEYAVDLNRLLGRERSQADKDTQLKGLLVSAGFQF